MMPPQHYLGSYLVFPTCMPYHAYAISHSNMWPIINDNNNSFVSSFADDKRARIAIIAYGDVKQTMHNDLKHTTNGKR